MTIEPAPRPALQIRDLPCADKPRERMLRQGPQALATAELLAILVGSGCRGANALDLGRELLARFGLPGLALATIDEMCQLPGCGPVKAVQVQAAIELGRRAGLQDGPEPVRVTSPSEAAELLQSEMGMLEQEHLRVVLLSMKNHVLGVHEVYKGSVCASLVRVGEVYREAVRRNCPAIIVAHNHPSGDPAPSPEDIHITRQLVEAGRLLDIELLDHLIIGRRRWVSLRERGLGFG